MNKYILFINGVLSARYDIAIHGDAIPIESTPVSDALFWQTINETDGIWTLHPDGSIIKEPFPPKTAEQLALEAATEAKRLKELALNTITVTTSNGKVFDGNETARTNLLSAITAAAFLGQTSANWKLADNTVALVTLDEVKEALALSVQRVGDIVTA